MEEGNMFRCGHCEKNVPGRKQFDVWRLPPYLVLNLKRYGTRLTTKGLHTLKSEERVHFPLVGLDLSAFNSAAKAEFGDGPESKACSIYDCVAVVQQHGQMKGGHCALRAPPPIPYTRAPILQILSAPSPPPPSQTPRTSTPPRA